MGSHKLSKHKVDDCKVASKRYIKQLKAQSAATVTKLSSKYNQGRTW